MGPFGQTNHVHVYVYLLAFVSSGQGVERWGTAVGLDGRLQRRPVVGLLGSELRRDLPQRRHRARRLLHQQQDHQLRCFFSVYYCL